MIMPHQILVARALQQLLVEFLGLVQAHLEGFLYGANEIVAHGLQHRLFFTIRGISAEE